MSSINPATQPGMGAMPHEHGTTFRVWAPHADDISVIGDFNQWIPSTHRLLHENNGYWGADIPGAKAGQEYLYHLKTSFGEFTRIDPYARHVTSSVGNAIIYDRTFNWDNDFHRTLSWNEWVIYEMHIGTFHDPRPNESAPGTFADAVKRFDHLKRLGVNCIQVMPIAEFAGDRSWGYNPSHPFAVENAYGGPTEFKKFVQEAHRQGFAVILDVVYNHFGPSDLHLWQFDGWHENDGGGIYFYQDWRKDTPWGSTRPDYGRSEVRQYILDNSLMWIEEYHVDGLRMDMTLYIRSVRADGEANLPDGWTLMQMLNSEIHAKHPNTITIAEDLQKSEWLTKKVPDGGAGYSSQWDDQFVHPIREAVITMADEHRSMVAVANAITHRYNSDSFERVIYSESHDEVANGRARVVHEIAPDDPNNYFAQKRSTLAAALVFTSPGIPMLFQGQEMLEGGWFRDTVPIDWDNSEEFRGIIRMFRDLIRLRLNRTGKTRGLCCQNVKITHIFDDRNMIAFRRWEHGGPNDDVMVVANFHRDPRTGYPLGFPSVGRWQLLFNSDAKIYSQHFGDYSSGDVVTEPSNHDGLPARGIVNIGPYSVLIYGKAE